MANKLYLLISGMIFGLVAIAHGVRLLNNLTIQINGIVVPPWISWPGMVVTAMLCLWALWSVSISRKSR